MAYLTQFSSNIPVIKFHIDQQLMTIGQDIDMDICVPEEGIADKHAIVEAIEEAGSYRFMVKSQEEASVFDLNGVTTVSAKLENGDWLVIGGVEFQFTDDGIDAIKKDMKPVLTKTTSAKQTQSPALKLIKDLKQELQEDFKPMSTKEFIANSRKSRRRLAF